MCSVWSARGFIKVQMFHNNKKRFPENLLMLDPHSHLKMGQGQPPLQRGHACCSSTMVTPTPHLMVLLSVGLKSLGFPSAPHSKEHLRCLLICEPTSTITIPNKGLQAPAESGSSWTEIIL